MSSIVTIDCLNGEGQAIDRNYTRQEGQPSPEGFIYKVKGFTIGNRDVLRREFKQPQLYRWYTGEIYVLDDAVVPNAGRDGFETSEARRSLELAVKKTLGALEKEALDFQTYTVAKERVLEAEPRLEEIAGEIEANLVGDPLRTYSELNEIVRKLSTQKKNKARDYRVRLDDGIRRAKRLQDTLQKEVDQPRTEASRAKKAAKGGHRRQPERRQEAPVPRLPTTLPEAGVDLDGPLGDFVAIVQEVLEDVLSTDSPVYRSIVSGITARAAEVSGAES